MAVENISFWREWAGHGVGDGDYDKDVKDVDDEENGDDVDEDDNDEENGEDEENGDDEENGERRRWHCWEFACHGLSQYKYS